MIQVSLEALWMLLKNNYILATMAVIITVVVLLRPDAQKEHKQVHSKNDCQVMK